MIIPNLKLIKCKYITLLIVVLKIVNPFNFRSGQLSVTNCDKQRNKSPVKKKKCDKSSFQISIAVKIGFLCTFDIRINKKEKMSENNQSRGQQQNQGGRGRSGRGRSRRGGGGGGSSKTPNDANHNERQRLYSECSEDHCAVCLNRLVIFAVGRCNHPGFRFN